jgi:hypothetical protein
MIRNPYVERLAKEWIEHNNIIIGVDFDDTIFPYREDITDHKEVIESIKKAQSSNAIIIIYTGSSETRYPEILEYCKRHGINVSKINENVITPFGDNRKIYCNIYLDDRSGLKESINILNSALYIYRAHKIRESLDKLGEHAE